VEWFETGCPQPSEAHRAAAEARQNVLTKPPGSLGVLEALAIKLAALQATDRPRAARAPIVLFAGDHGVTAQGVSAYPADVTVQMLHNFAAGGAAIAVLARELGLKLHVVDAGTLSEHDVPGVTTDKPRRGTRDFSHEAAMTDDELSSALKAGRRAVERARAGGADLVILGEMGIGNTTSAAAIAAALLGARADAVVGAGTGLDAAGVSRKAEVIEAALAAHGLRDADVSAAQVLRCVGGLEIAALAGAMQEGEVRSWQVRHKIPYGNNQGDMQITRSIVTPLASCKEVMFTVDDAKAAQVSDGAPRGWFAAHVCLQENGWKWANAEPAVERWGALH
jgi:nicotinate-nucleotide--dimethylbenzimidazole phosphoribosyltransferase